MAEFYKGDPRELQFFNSGEPVLTEISDQRGDFFDDAFAAAPLGDLLFDLNLAPLVGAIQKPIFRNSFSEVFTSFVETGTFGSYLVVFESIFGAEADITFTIPNPGHLQIDIVADGLELSPFTTRYIENNTYVYDHIVTQSGDRIVFQTIKGFESEYELELMLKEMVPQGIFTEISLTIGS